MNKQVDGIKSKEKDPYDFWRFYDSQSSFKDNDKEQKTDPQAIQKGISIDTLETLSPPLAIVAEPTPPPIEVKASSAFSIDGIIELGKKVWEYFCVPIVVQRENVGAAGKPAGDSIQPIGGSPALTAPGIVLDKEMLRKLLEDLQKSFQQVAQVVNDSDDEVKEDERRVLQCYAQQMKIRDEGVETLKFQVIFDQQNDRKIRKENYNYEGETIEIGKKQKFWSAASTTFAVASVALFITTAVAAFFSTGGAAAIPAVVTGIKFTVSLLSGGTQIIKANIDFDMKQRQGESVKLRQVHVHIDFRIKDGIILMRSGIDQVSKIVEMKEQVIKSLHETSRSVLK